MHVYAYGFWFKPEWWSLIHSNLDWRLLSPPWFFCHGSVRHINPPIVLLSRPQESSWWGPWKEPWTRSWNKEVKGIKEWGGWDQKEGQPWDDCPSQAHEGQDLISCVSWFPHSSVCPFLLPLIKTVTMQITNLYYKPVFLLGAPHPDVIDLNRLSSKEFLSLSKALSRNDMLISHIPACKCFDWKHSIIKINLSSAMMTAIYTYYTIIQ